MSSVRALAGSKSGSGEVRWSAKRRPEPGPSDHSGAVRHARTVATALALVPVLIGVGVLVGYALRIAILVQLRSDLPPMYPNAAVGFIIAGTAVLFQLWSGPRVARVAGTVGAVLLTVIFGIHLIENLLGAGATLADRLLMPANPVVEPTTVVANRPVLETCLSMLLLAVALYRTSRGSRMGAGGQLAATAATMIGLTALLGYLYGVDRTVLGRSSVATVGMALHTASSVACLGLAILLCRPLDGWVGLVSRTGAAGTLSRRMVLVAVAVPLLLSGSLAVVSHVFVDNTALALSIVAVVQVAAITAVLLSPLQALARFDRERAEAIAAAGRSRDALQEQIPLMEALRSELAYVPTDIDARITLVSHVEPAHGVLAGDWLDFVAVSGQPDRFRLVLLDVSGHGAASAMFALRLRDALLVSLVRGDPLTVALSELRVFFRSMAFITTALVVEIDLHRRTLTWVNAGHPPGLCLNGSSVVSLDPTGPLLGLTNATWHQEETTFPPGAVLISYTDGVTEARNASGVLFGEQRLRRTAKRWGPQGAAATVSALVSESKRHSAGSYADDATVVAIEAPALEPIRSTDSESRDHDAALWGPAHDLAPAWIELTQEPSTITVGRHLVRDQLGGHAAELLTSELLTNAVQHGSEPISLRITTRAGSTRVEVRDANVNRIPQVMAADHERASARGMVLVQALARSWGVEVASHTKTVWFEVTTG